MGKKNSCCVSFALCMLLLPASLGCTKRLDENSATDSTVNKLETLAVVVANCLNNGVPAATIATLPKLLEVGRSRRYIELDAFPKGFYEVDFWGNSFEYQLKITESEIRVRILSFGRNGVSDGGEGDDLVVEISKDLKNHNKKARVHVKPHE